MTPVMGKGFFLFSQDLGSQGRDIAWCLLLTGANVTSTYMSMDCSAIHKERFRDPYTELSGPISRGTGILSLRYPISHDTFSVSLPIPTKGAMPPLDSSLTQTYLCDATYHTVVARQAAETRTNYFCGAKVTEALRDMRSIASGLLRQGALPCQGRRCDQRISNFRVPWFIHSSLNCLSCRVGGKLTVLFYRG